MSQGGPMASCPTQMQSTQIARLWARKCRHQQASSPSLHSQAPHTSQLCSDPRASSTPGSCNTCPSMPDPHTARGCPTRTSSWPCVTCPDHHGIIFSLQLFCGPAMSQALSPLSMDSTACTQACTEPGQHFCAVLVAPGLCFHSRASHWISKHRVGTGAQGRGHLGTGAGQCISGLVGSLGRRRCLPLKLSQALLGRCVMTGEGGHSPTSDSA